MHLYKSVGMELISMHIHTLFLCDFAGSSHCSVSRERYKRQSQVLAEGAVPVRS